MIERRLVQSNLDFCQMVWYFRYFLIIGLITVIDIIRQLINALFAPHQTAAYQKDLIETIYICLCKLFSKFKITDQNHWLLTKYCYYKFEFQIPVSSHASFKVGVMEQLMNRKNGKTNHWIDTRMCLYKKVSLILMSP